MFLLINDAYVYLVSLTLIGAKSRINEPNSNCEQCCESKRKNAKFDAFTLITITFRINPLHDNKLDPLARHLIGRL